MKALKKILIVVAIAFGLLIVLPVVFDLPEPDKNNSSTDTNVATQSSQPKEITVNGVKLNRAEIMNGKISILIPEGFREMTASEIAIKYPTNNAPNLVYTDESTKINLSFGHTKNPIKESQLSELHKVLDAQNRQISKQLMKSELQEINGQKASVIEMITPALDSDIYNLMYHTSYQGTLLVTSFNLTTDKMDKWQKVASAVIESIELK